MTSAGVLDITEQEKFQRLKILRKNPMFTRCSDQSLTPLIAKMQPRSFRKGEIIAEQDAPQTDVVYVTQGTVARLRTDNQGVQHHVEPPGRLNVFGSLHAAREEPSFATLKCTTDVKAFVLPSAEVRKAIENPVFAEEVIFSLCKEVRYMSRQMRTPLLEQQSRKVNFLATTVAASVESFYRSALNALLNRRLTGTMGALFPDMHVQIPSRIFYINGLKGIRRYFDQHVDPDEFNYPTLVRFGVAISPGILMSPISSVLEAANANLNTEPMYKRWMRGYIPRAAREVIFGVGLNQLSDYFEERIPETLNIAPAMRTAAGSLTAGVVAGYLSHVPHNLSALKLMNPQRTYGQLFREFAKKSETRLPEGTPAYLRPPLSGVLSVVAPLGVHIRTTQIVGTFVMLNGLISLLQ